MSDEKIRVQFETTKGKLGVILPLLVGEVENIATRSMAEIIASRAAKVAPYVPKADPQAAVRKGAMPLHRAVFERMVAAGTKAGDTLTYENIQAMLVQSGFSPTSLSPAISYLVNFGICERTGRRGEGKLIVKKMELP